MNSFPLPLHIALLLGSIREGRRTVHLARHLEQLFAASPGVEARLLDLQSWELPLLENRWAEQTPPPPALAAFSQELRQADALIFLSPEYHGSYTGVLKNAIDHFWKEFERKPIGVAATGAGRFGGINASTEMQQLVLSLGAFPMPFKLLAPRIQDAFGPEGEIRDPQLLKDSQHFVDEFLWFARALTAARRQPVASAH